MTDEQFFHTEISRILQNARKQALIQDRITATERTGTFSGHLDNTLAGKKALAKMKVKFKPLQVNQSLRPFGDRIRQQFDHIPAFTKRIEQQARMKQFLPSNNEIKSQVPPRHYLSPQPEMYSSKDTPTLGHEGISQKPIGGNTLKHQKSLDLLNVKNGSSVIRKDHNEIENGWQSKSSKFYQYLDQKFAVPDFALPSTKSPKNNTNIYNPSHSRTPVMDSGSNNVFLTDQDYSGETSPNFIHPKTLRRQPILSLNERNLPNVNAKNTDMKQFHDEVTTKWLKGSDTTRVPPPLVPGSGKIIHKPGSYFTKASFTERHSKKKSCKEESSDLEDVSSKLKEFLEHLQLSHEDLREEMVPLRAQINSISTQYKGSLSRLTQGERGDDRLVLDHLERAEESKSEKNRKQMWRFRTLNRKFISIFLARKK